MTIKITWNSSWVPFPLGILFFWGGGGGCEGGGGYYFLYSFGQLVLIWDFFVLSLLTSYFDLSQIWLRCCCNIK